MEDKKSRNCKVDMLRGLAAIMVLVSHTMMISLENYSSLKIFNIIWTIQMPLFFLISGYLSRYSKNDDSFKELTLSIWKKTVIYLGPWVFWVFGVKYLRDSNHNLLNFTKDVFINIESAYWFLFVLWIICTLFRISLFFVSKLRIKQKIVNDFLISVNLYLLTIPLVISSYLIGKTFLGTKYVLYYGIFYLVGYFLHYLKNVNEKIVAFGSFPIVVVYSIMILNFNFYTLEDTLFNIAIRFAVSLMGCYICWMFINSINNKYASVLLRYCGENSMAIYLLHTLFLMNYIVEGSGINSYSFEGIGVFSINLLVLILTTLLGIRICRFSKLGYFLISGKWCNKHENTIN